MASSGLLVSLIWKISKTPEAETLVSPASIAFIASLVDQYDGCRPIEGRVLHVQGSPIAVLAIHVDPPLREGRRQKPTCTARAEMSNGTLDMAEAEMDEAVSAKNKICAR
jgi:hypothetical protein